MKKTNITSSIHLIIALLIVACNSSSSNVPIGDSIKVVTDSAAMSATMLPNNTNNDTSTMLNNSMSKDLMAMDTSKMKSKVKHR